MFLCSYAYMNMGSGSSVERLWTVMHGVAGRQRGTTAWARCINVQELVSVTFVVFIKRMRYHCKTAAILVTASKFSSRQCSYHSTQASDCLKDQQYPSTIEKADSLNKHTPIPLKPSVEWCSSGCASFASSGLLPGSSIENTTQLMAVPTNCGSVV